jgi:hypothetical protein
VLAATHPGGYRASLCNPGHLGPLEYVISKIKNIDQRDHKGLSALHLSSTVSECTTKRLLDAGANPTLVTLDGLTPLSLAIRARHSNIVGLLLEFSKKSSVDAILRYDGKGRSPLYYACRSGRPESLRLLLDAGADISQENLYSGCAEFEEEERLWDQKRHPADAEANQSTSGLTIDDTTRPVIKSTDYQQRLDVQKTARLEEIVKMLKDHGCVLPDFGPNRASRSSRVLDSAAIAGHNYAFTCLLRARKSLPEDQGIAFSAVVWLAQHTVKACEEAHKAATANLPGLKNEIPTRK